MPALQRRAAAFAQLSPFPRRKPHPVADTRPDWQNKCVQMNSPSTDRATPKERLASLVKHKPVDKSE